MEAAYGLSITITMMMTTLLLAFYLKMQRIKLIFIIPFVSVFLGIELSFFVANMFKFLHGGWATILIAGVIAGVMFVWYNARKIKNKHMQFMKIENYINVLSDVKKDESIPKYATNLIYLSKADKNTDIEGKIIYSIINKQPKRADHYWLLHIDHLDDPTTFEYSYDVLIPDTLYRVNIRLGFRVQPLINMYFRQIIEDLVANKEFVLTSQYPSLAKNNIPGDFRFVIIHRIYNFDLGTRFKERITMTLYNTIKYLGISDIKSYGLDTSNVMVESVPLLLKQEYKAKIKRIDLD